MPSTTCLHIPLAHPCLYHYLLSSQYTVSHILFLLHILLYFLFLFFFNLYLYIFSCVVLHILHCPLSRPDLIYISLPIIFCIIEYVTNKETLNLLVFLCPQEHFNTLSCPFSLQRLVEGRRLLLWWLRRTFPAPCPSCR